MARHLARQGVPIFLAEADGAGGFHHPSGWERTEADPEVLDAWQPGMAVCAVMGVVCDGIDTDPRHDGNASASALRAAGAYPRSYGRAHTPSDGTHDLAPRLHEGSRDNLRPGVDLKGGRDDGTGRGFLYIAPTVRASKVTGEPVAYRWERAPDLDGITEDEDSDEAQRLAEAVRQSRPGSQATREPTEPVERDEQDDTLRRRVDAYVAAVVQGECRALREMAAWPDGHRDEKGRGWEKRSADAALRLGALARATWNGLTEDEARQAHLAAAPTCSTFTAAEKWAQQHRRGEAAPWPGSLDNDDTGVTFMATKPSQPADDGDEDDEQVASTAGTSWALDEAHLADRVAGEVLAGQFCWSGALGWVRWDGRRWKSSPEAAVIEAVRRYFIKLHAVAARRGAGVDVLKALSSLLWRARIANVVSLARGIVLVDAASFDQHPDLLNVGNGVVNLRTGELLPHDPALKLTRLTTTHYDPAATHPDWEAAGQSLPAEVLDCLQVRMGQAATGHMTPDDVLVVLQGGGQNSKSTITGAVQASLAEHAVLVSDRLLLASPDAHPTEQMDLRGARFALIEETPEARRLSVARLKKAVGTPLITARRIRADPVTFPATHSLFLTSNYRPQIEETDHGTWRRLALVVFRFTYRAPGEPLRSDTDRHGDPGLRERLLHGEAQHRAVLRWLVDGAVAWYAADRVLPPLPALVVADTLAWRTEADHVLGYITERLVFDRDSHVMGTDLLADFNAWAETRGLRPWGNQTLAERFGGHSTVTAADVQQGRLSSGQGLSRWPGTLLGSVAPTRFRGWAGVRFRTDADDAREALQAPVDGVDGVPGRTTHLPSRSAYPTTPSTPSSEWQDEADAPF